ncbi:MAG: glycosyltransferase family 9 protein [Fusobacteriaceae bacterium]|jgi:ADP-heptose:LPS heptosyltransferase|nr:glycosyltransferase family 9 protein [Fusobacteriaceae bacterium]
MKKQIKRIIIANTGKIRSMVLSIPTFFLAKKMYPEAEIVVLARRYNYEIARNLPYIDRIFILEDYKKTEVEDKIAYFNADAFIALNEDKYLEKMAKASRAKIRIGPIRSFSALLTWNKGAVQLRSKAAKNEGEYNIELLKKLNRKLYAENYTLNTKLWLSPAGKVAADAFFKSGNIAGPVLVVNPFTAGSGKNLSDEQYAALLKKFHAKNRDVRVIILCEIDQEDRAAKLMENAGNEGILIFPNGGDLLNIAAVIDKGSLYLGPVAGPTQMAGALRKPAIVICPARPNYGRERWGLLGDEKAIYITPDGRPGKKENYRKKNFETYDREVEDLILTELGKFFRFHA